MDRDLSELLGQIERMERERPRAFLARVLTFAMTGHAALALHRAGLALRALVQPVPEPIGVPLDAETAPALAALVEDLCVRLHAGYPSPRSALRASGCVAPRILITPDLNASVTDRPHGFTVRRRTVLLLGLPLLHALSPDELRAVLAHELGHLARRHGRLSPWIWRLRQAWAEAGEEMRRGREPFRSFARWYVPRFAAWTLAQARAQEREADRMAAEATSPRIAADALTRVRLVHELAEAEFWPEMSRRARAGETLAPQSELAAFVRRLPGESAGALLEAAIAATPGPWDAHPPLGTRLRELGATPRLPPPVAETAAERFIGPACAPLACVLDGAWSAARAQGRAEEAEHREAEDAAPLRTERRERARVRHRELRARQAERELEPSEAWELAMVAGEIEGPAMRRELLEALLAREPAHAATCFELGRLLLQAGEDRGAELLQRAGEIDPALQRPAAQVLLARAERSGEAGRARELRAELATHGDIETRASEERSRLPWSLNHYSAHALPDEIVGGLRSLAAAIPGARRVILCERQVQVLPQRRAWLLGVERDPGHHERPGRDREIADLLLEGVDVGGHLSCLVASTEGRVMLCRLASIPGVVIWQRGA